MEYKILTNCRICKSPNLHKYLSLGEVPLANSLLNSPEQESKKYPIEVMLCLDCSLSQLSIVVDQKVMFSDYPYHSSVSQTFKDHCREMARTIKPMLNIPDRPYWMDNNIDWESKWFPTVLDIACNDGCLLREFLEEGYGVLGVDPAENFNSTDMLKKKLEDGTVEYTDVIPIHTMYWTKKNAEEVLTSMTRPNFGERRSLITAQNVLAHVDDLEDFLGGVHVALEGNGIFVAEFPYLPNLIENNQFDTIYHEHLSYFLLKPLIRLFKDNGLQIFKVEQYPIHGGSIRIYASKYAYDVQESVRQMLDFEEAKELYSIETYTRFGDRVLRVMNDLKMCLENIYESGKKVMAYGASAKGISLMNYSGIKREWIHAVVDDTQDKQGKFTPGTLIPIINSNGFKDEAAHFIILLAWNFRQELMAKCWWHSGYFIIPIPEVSVI